MQPRIPQFKYFLHTTWLFGIQEHSSYRVVIAFEGKGHTKLCRPLLTYILTATYISVRKPEKKYGIIDELSKLFKLGTYYVPI